MDTKITPLLRFLRAFPGKPERKAFAEACETTELYLYQIAAQPYPNPRLRLALALVRESKKIARKLMTQPLTLEDLLVGTGDESERPRNGVDG
ncbi:hypothetical protein [Rubrivivax rivuli]|uniref:Uncharacterized protein n=1 Tax=Rubrivivax rivuli TaxID=1862385 RepID=A0A437REY7_9BURK|nr:hypothetical protein [Rubrivivax rivuli]RVU45330.1 hypothetical protein EOE66_14480 [Rubrivivax rivuli]